MTTPNLIQARSFKELVDAEWTSIESADDKPASNTGITTGYALIDNQCNGFKPGELTVVAVRPGMCLTQFWFHFIGCSAIDRKVPIGVVSTKWSESGFIRWLLSARSKTDLVAGEYEALSPTEKKRACDAVGKISHAPIFMQANPLALHYHWEDAIRMFVKTNKAKAVFIDDLYWFRNLTGSDMKTAVVMKRLAGELNVPVICAVELGEATEANRRLSPLAELDFESIVDLVISLHYETFYPPGENSYKSEDFNKLRKEVQVYVAKNRMTFSCEIVRAKLDDDANFFQ